MSVCCECCVLSGRGLCDELITSPEESYRLWCVVVCDVETSIMRLPRPAIGRSATKKKVCAALSFCFASLSVNLLYILVVNKGENVILVLIPSKTNSGENLPTTASFQILSNFQSSSKHSTVCKMSCNLLQ